MWPDVSCWKAFPQTIHSEWYNLPNKEHESADTPNLTNTDIKLSSAWIGHPMWQWYSPAFICVHIACCNATSTRHQYPRVDHDACQLLMQLMICGEIGDDKDTKPKHIFPLEQKVWNNYFSLINMNCLLARWRWQMTWVACWYTQADIGPCNDSIDTLINVVFINRDFQCQCIGQAPGVE